MTEQKLQQIDAFIYNVILTDEFFDTVFDALEEEIDLEDEALEEFVEEQQAVYEQALANDLTIFLDKNFSDQEIHAMVEEADESVISKFDSLSDSFYQIIENHTAQFVNKIVSQVAECETEGDSCCH